MSSRGSAQPGPLNGEPAPATALALALVEALDDEATRELANRLRPHLPAEAERLLDAREAAALLGLHPDTLVRMARTGRIWAKKVGREWRFRADNLDIGPVAGSLPASPTPMRRRRPQATARPSIAAIRGRS